MGCPIAFFGITKDADHPVTKALAEDQIAVLEEIRNVLGQLLQGQRSGFGFG